MTRRNWVWVVALAVPAVVGGLTYADAEKATGDPCPPDCGPINQHMAPAAEQSQPADDGYTCPVTGETLPCPNCCPLNKTKK
jgi:hypothetical protein